MAVVEDLRDMFRVSQLQRMRKAKDSQLPPRDPEGPIDPPGLPRPPRYMLAYPGASAPDIQPTLQCFV